MLLARFHKLTKQEEIQCFKLAVAINSAIVHETLKMNIISDEMDDVKHVLFWNGR